MKMTKVKESLLGNEGGENEKGLGWFLITIKILMVSLALIIIIGSSLSLLIS